MAHGTFTIDAFEAAEELTAAQRAKLKDEILRVFCHRETTSARGETGETVTTLYADVVMEHRFRRGEAAEYVNKTVLLSMNGKDIAAQCKDEATKTGSGKESDPGCAITFVGSKDLDASIDCTLCFPASTRANNTTPDDRCAEYKDAPFVVYACTTDCATIFFR